MPPQKQLPTFVEMKTNSLFSELETKNLTTEQLQRLDLNSALRTKLLPLCRLKYGEIWEDPVKGHKVGVLDATKIEDVKEIMADKKAHLVVNDPPYNVIVGNANTNRLFKISFKDYLVFSEKWIKNAIAIMAHDAHLYIWIGADYKEQLPTSARYNDSNAKV